MGFINKVLSKNLYRAFPISSPHGTLTITSNGSYNVFDYATAKVKVVDTSVVEDLGFFYGSTSSSVSAKTLHLRGYTLATRPQFVIITLEDLSSFYDNPISDTLITATIDTKNEIGYYEYYSNGSYGVASCSVSVGGTDNDIQVTVTLQDTLFKTFTKYHPLIFKGANES